MEDVVTEVVKLTDHAPLSPRLSGHAGGQVKSTFERGSLLAVELVISVEATFEKMLGALG